MGSLQVWGVKNIVLRLVRGIDPELQALILKHPKWTGTPADLDALCSTVNLGLPAVLPLRDSIDMMHSLVYSTIHALRFSRLPPVCGGPIEIGVITTDRPFRWVRHKEFDAAIR